MEASRIVIAGGSGHLGRLLTTHFENQGREVVVLSRSEGKGVTKWDGRTHGFWAQSLEGADAVINMSGKSIESRWTEKNKRAFESARVESTLAIGEAVRKAQTPPRLWINASAIGIYGDTGARVATEATRPGDDFLGGLCERWERACLQHDTPGTRKVCLRTGVVLQPGSAFVKAVTIAAKLGVAAPLGSGRQFVSWIHPHDLIKMVEWCFFEPVTGPLNVCAPNPVTNATLMAEFRRVYDRPPLPPVPAPLVRLVVGLLGKEPSLLLTGQRALPEIALARGFRFKFETVREALEDVLGAIPAAWKAA